MKRDGDAPSTSCLECQSLSSSSVSSVEKPSRAIHALATFPPMGLERCCTRSGAYAGFSDGNHRPSATQAALAGVPARGRLHGVCDRSAVSDFAVSRGLRGVSGSRSGGPRAMPGPDDHDRVQAIARGFSARSRVAESASEVARASGLVRESIELQRIRQEEPQLRRAGSSLFAEMEEWDFAASRLPSYRRVLRRLRRLDEQIHGETKFFLIARYQLADRLYLAAPRGMIRPCELPRGWGLLECPTRCLERIDQEIRLDEPPALRVRVEAAELRPRADFRMRLLRQIAVAATMRAHQRGAPVSTCKASAAPA